MDKFKGLSKKEVLNEIDKALAWKRENSKIEFFTPTGKQEEFIRLVGNSTHFVNILSAANRIGKTTLVANILGNILFGPQTKYFNYPLFENFKFPKKIRYITESKLVEEVGPFHAAISEYWPKGRYEINKTGHAYYSQYKANGFIVDVMTYEQEAKEFEGSGLGMVIFDEPPPKDIWAACLPRLAMGGLILVLMTPLTSAAWFFDEVVPNYQNSTVYASIEDACKTHGIRGHLDHDQIVKIMANLDPLEVDARAYGKAMYLSGLIFKEFDYNVHVAKKAIDVPEDAEVIQVVDPHVDKPFACIWAYPSLDGTLYQFAEWPNEDFYKIHGCSLGLKDYVDLFKRKESGWNVRKRIIDRHFAETRILNTNRTLREEFAGLGINFEPSYTSGEEVETGILKVRSKLKYNTKKPIDAVNRPTYIVSPACTNTIKGFQRWAFDPKTGKIQEDYKDYMDCVRYLVMADPKISYTPPPPIYRKIYA